MNQEFPCRTKPRNCDQKSLQKSLCRCLDFLRQGSIFLRNSVDAPVGNLGKQEHRTVAKSIRACSALGNNDGGGDDGDDDDDDDDCVYYDCTFLT